MVATLVVLETMQIVIFFELLFQLFIVQPEEKSSTSHLIHNLYRGPDSYYWEELAQAFPTYLSAFLVQVHFAICVYHLKKTGRLAPICIAVLASISLLAGFGQAIVSMIFVANGNIWETSTAVGVVVDGPELILYFIQSSTALLCNATITTCLIRRVDNAKSGIKKSDTMINRIMTNAINRGGLLAAMSAITLILIMTAAKGLTFYLPLLVGSQLYMNSVLASLNARDSINEKYTNVPVTDSDIVISNGPLSTIRFAQFNPQERSVAAPVFEVGLDSDSFTDNQRGSKIKRYVGGEGMV